MPPPSTPKSLSESGKILDKPTISKKIKSPKKPKDFEKDKEELVTPDFKPMLQIIFWNSLGFFFFSFLMPYATLQILGGSGTDLGFVVSGSTIGGLISALIVGYLTDKYSKKILVLIGSFGRAISYIIMYLSIIFKSFLGFAFAIFFLGFAVGFFWTPLDALISQKSYKTYRAAAFGKRGGKIGMGNLFGSLISLTIFAISYTFIPDMTWVVYSPLLLFTFSNIYAGIIFFKKTDENLTYDIYMSSLENDPESSIVIDLVTKENSNLEKSENNNNNNNRKSLLVFGFITFMLAFMLTSINQSLSYPYLQPYLIENFVQNPILVMLVYLPSELIAQLLAPKLGVLADKINPRITILITGILGASITWFLINSPSEWIFGLLLVFDMVFAWLGMLILQNFLSRFSKTHRGKIFGIRQWVGLLGGVIGPILGGYAWIISHQMPFIISIFVELALIPLFILALYALKPFVAEKI
ncbi:MFS transporter [Promethearchaeum syntrophicum]|uniref:MFS transporter n=1 Tax=Promethearchaeum syntrophicum TaxID=2594042 RepID=A0A5B9D8U7_9ARCH|nr:MFS transporter [Candidatus Prometheoarchaeum syntrophicum]QEE15534.1 Major Facilitator Superfamily protein [Candidatus Prometheoarchaeum syntrophicum]